MSDEIKALNIPNVTVSETIARLAELYANAIRKCVALKKLPTPFLWGAAGVGKSDGIHQLAEKLEQMTEKKVFVTDIRLLLFSPIDLRGVPVADEHKEFTNWLKPKIFDMDCGNETINILFLDELSAAPQSVQAAAYQICLDRKVGEHVLPENCIVIAAGNRVTDQSVSYKMPKALCNRLMHFNIKSDYEAWKAWAVQNNVSDKVIAFLGLDNSRLCVEPETSDLAYATPRSWAFVSTLLHTVSDDPEAIHSLIAACVGNATALEFEAFCRSVLHMPSVKDILNGKCSDYPKTHDVMYALISSLVSLLRGKGDEITQSELENVCSYVLHLPKDFAMSFMKDISKISTINKKLMKCHSFQTWLNKNKALI